MKQIFSNLWAVIAMALTLAIGSSAFAQQVVPDVGGYETAPGGSTVFTPVSVNGDGTVTIRFDNMEGSQFRAAVGGVKAYRGPVKDRPTGRDIWNYKIPSGSTVLLFKLGDEWGEMGGEVEEVDASKAKARGVINNGSVTIAGIPPDAKGRSCQTFTMVVQVAGTTAPSDRLWGNHGPLSDPWVVPNSKGSPRTAFCVRGGQMVNVDVFNPAIRAQLAQRH